MVILMNRLSIKKTINIKNIYFLIFGLLLCFLVLNSVTTIAQWMIQLTQSQDLDYAESWHAYVAYNAYPGGDHVGSSYEMPYNTLPYPPISYLVHGWLGKIIGANLIGVRNIGRATMLFMTLANSFLIVLIGRLLNVRIIWSIIAGLLFLTSQSAHLFAVSLRPDEMALTLTLLGLYCLLNKNPKYWLVGMFVALAIGIKHSSISFPLVVTANLLIQRKFKPLGKFIVGGIVIGLSSALMGFWMLGSYWWQGSLLQGFHGADIKQAIYFIGQGFQQPILVLGLASVVWIGFEEKIGIVVSTFLVSLVLNSIALVKVGAAENYFLEPVAFASILVAYLSTKIFKKNRWLVKGFAVSLLLALIIPSTVSQLDTTINALKNRNVVLSNREELLTIVKQIEDPILSDQAWIYTETGHQPYNSPPDLIMAAVEGGKIDGKSMEAFIEAQQFNAIIVRKNWKERRHFPESWISAIDNKYEIWNQDYGYYILKPFQK